MIKLYIADVSALDIPAALERVTLTRREKAMRLCGDLNKRQSLGAALLMYKAVNGGVPFDYSVGENGKPYCEGLWHFSLSHCGELAVCAVSDRPVGVDIECPRKNSLRLAERIFAPEVCEVIAGSDEPDEKFCEYWTCAESFIKQTGEGIAKGMQRLDLLTLSKSKSLKHMKYGDCHISVCIASGDIGDIDIHDEKII